MDAVLDTAFPLAYRDQVLRFLLPLFPPPISETKPPHVHSLTRLLVTLSSPELTVPFLMTMVPKQKLLAYQFAFDLVEGGAQDFLESVRKDLPEGDLVRNISTQTFWWMVIDKHIANATRFRQTSEDPSGTGIHQALSRIPQAE